MGNYVCKIATVDEMNTKWDYEIDHATKGKNNWIIWKKENLERFQISRRKNSLLNSI